MAFDEPHPRKLLAVMHDSIHVARCIPSIGDPGRDRRLFPAGHFLRALEHRTLVDGAAVVSRRTKPPGAARSMR
jgi:hypothetical protein